MKFFSRVVLILLIFLLRVVPCEAAGKVIIISLNRTGLHQVAQSRNLGPWLARGAVGLLNVGTADRPTSEHSYVTLGAGSRAMGTEYTRLAFNAEEEYAGVLARELFFRHQGFKPDGLVLQTVPAAAVRANKALRHPVVPGLLGETLREGGRATAVLGNADGQGYFRESAAMLADRSGQVMLGDVSRGILKHEERFPFSVRVDREDAWQRFSALYEEADVILVDWGDTVRLDEYRPLLSENVYAGLQEEIYADSAWFIEHASGRLGDEDLLILLSPAPPAGESGAGLLSYILVLGSDFPAGSLLMSGSTRRAGIVLSTDVAPLILNQSGLDVPGMMLGRVIIASGSGGAGDLLAMQAGIDRIFRLRPPLLKTYVFLQIVIVLGALLNLFVRIVRNELFEPLLLALLLFPIVVLYLPLQNFTQISAFLVTFAAMVTAVALVYYLIPRAESRFAVIGLLTASSLAFDIVRGAPLMKVSVLGYDVVSGARFYGLGNEYMGVLVGSAILGATAFFSLFPLRRKVLLPALSLFFFSLVLLIVAPAGGANFGGTVTAMVAFLVTLLVLGQVRPGWRNGLSLLALLTGVAVLAVLINLRVPEGGQSHLGRTLFLLNSEGAQALADVAARKASMNVKLFRYSQWSRAFLVFLAVLAVLFYRPRGMLTSVHQHYPGLSAGFLGIIAGSITALLLNDSGVVAAATTLLYAGVPIILLCGRTAGHNNFGVQ
ncbi:MAG: hypothetical protein KGZ79_15705 [Dethiobacter sp.]|nr:hypothetical protein [Dethiobacter sp.]